ncbi:hypothetical protein [Halobacillus sp. BBL2006]|uniref:hypothetical protein n=1 Tax=Halobacillus sp. BBL2006 TaxID=1543706 RepID=UPI0005443ACB|nr:hypothetical protein [Halobacillus sp. BBL2006]KHE68584.1 hypothetical protein LD39_14305 [Halobacillus sp. BBL2006]
MLAIFFVPEKILSSEKRMVHHSHYFIYAVSFGREISIFSLDVHGLLRELFISFVLLSALGSL